MNAAVVHTVVDTVSASAEGFPIRLGAGRVDQFLDGIIAKVVLSRVDSSEDVERIDHYLQQKYAAALATR